MVPENTTLPTWRIVTASQISSTSFMSWLLSTTDVPSRTSRSRSVRTWRVPAGSSERRRLIEEQQPRRAEEGSGKAETLAHTRRVSRDRPVGVVCEPRLFERVAHRPSLEPAAASVQSRNELEVLATR